MSETDVIRTLIETALSMGLGSTWQFWAVVGAVLVLLVWHKFAPRAPPSGPEGIPEHPQAPPIPMPPGGAPLDQKPKGPDDWAG